MSKLDVAAARPRVEELWEESILPELEAYIRIPCKSPAFDPDWESSGHIEAAVGHMARWAQSHLPEGAALEVVRAPGRTPVILIEVPARGGAGRDRPPVLLYGHLDKQPEMSGWRDGLGPWTPVRSGDRLYGRGGADDGYALYACLAALRILEEQEVDHAPCRILIEASEESGSPDLPHYFERLGERLGEPELVVCLDSGCGSYEQLWSTTSLRGLVSGTLRVAVLREGVHSGDASGIVPSSMRIARALLERVEDAATGALRPPALSVPIPEERVRQAAHAAQVLGEQVYRKFPFLEGVRPVAEDLQTLVLNRTWRGALEVTGAEGLPPLESAGNVLRPETALRLSFRIPPTLDPGQALAVLRDTLEADPPHGAHVRFEPDTPGPGWDAPPLAPWLEAATEEASLAWFGRSAVYMGEGGAIPFMGMLGARFPRAQFLVTGVLGPESNAHGPNEFLHIPTGKRLTGAVASILAHQATRPGQ